MTVFLKAAVFNSEIRVENRIRKMGGIGNYKIYESDGHSCRILRPALKGI